MYKAKQEFLWYKIGDTIKEEDIASCTGWEKDGLVELDKPKMFEKKEEVKVKKAPQKKVVKKKTKKSKK